MRRGVCKNILYDNAIELIKNNDVYIIDVREKEEITKNDNKILEWSINIPINKLTSEIKNFVPNKNQIILVFCSTGSRSIFACQILADMGYNKVYNLYGGIH